MRIYTAQMTRSGEPGQALINQAPFNDHVNMTNTGGSSLKSILKTSRYEKPRVSLWSIFKSTPVDTTVRMSPSDRTLCVYFNDERTSVQLIPGRKQGAALPILKSTIKQYFSDLQRVTLINWMTIQYAILRLNKI
jgi:hypothetical protein